MASDTNKKLSILYVWNVLKQYSDENHPLTQSEICDKIYQLYGMECERKSIASNIDALTDFGLDIIKVARKGCFLGERELEPSEVYFVIDAIFASKSIDGKHARVLAEKISKFLSVHQKRQFNYIYKADQVTRTNNNELFLNIEIIQEAIEKRKKISFAYCRPRFEKEKTEKRYVVNPYFLINSQGRYYLVCNYDYFDNIGNYKVELIQDIKLLDSDIKPITAVKGCEKGLDIAKYTNEHIYMFSKETVRATLKLSGEIAVGYVVDWFGENVRLFKRDGDLFAEVTANEQALIYWCLQYGEHIELVTPEKTRKAIKEKIENILKKY